MKLFHCFTLVAFLVLLSEAVSAQDIRLLSLNPSFQVTSIDPSLDGWNYQTGLEATTFTASTDGRDVNEVPFEYTISDVGTIRARLRGSGGFGQILEVPSDTKQLLMNLLAYRRRIDKSGPGTASTVVVTLYDAVRGYLHKRFNR